MPGEIRAFIATVLPHSAKERLQRLQVGLRRQSALRPVRWVEVSSIHLTLKFLGQVPVEEAEVITKALELACETIPPFRFTLRELGCFPNPRRPRVVWVGVVEPTGTLARLQGATEDACEQLGFNRDRRPYHPHLTVGRVRERVPSDKRRMVGEVIQRLDMDTLGSVSVSGIHLIRSDLQPDGPVYTSLAEIGLGEK